MTPPMMCLGFLVRDDHVLLGEKKRGFGCGKVVGPGGKVEPGETPPAAVVREIAEETGVSVDPGGMREVGWITYRFPHRPGWNQDATVFTVSHWTGEPAESDEIAPDWYAVDTLPLDRMWDDARHWLPRILAGEQLDVAAIFGPDNATVAEITVSPAARSRGIPGRSG